MTLELQFSFYILQNLYKIIFYIQYIDYLEICANIEEFFLKFDIILILAEILILVEIYAKIKKFFLKFNIIMLLTEMLILVSFIKLVAKFIQ